MRAPRKPIEALEGPLRTNLAIFLEAKHVKHRARVHAYEYNHAE